MIVMCAGEFTPENQQRLKAEEEKEQKELDPWKAKHFEPVWGQRSVLVVIFCLWCMYGLSDVCVWVVCGGGGGGMCPCLLKCTVCLYLCVSV